MGFNLTYTQKRTALIALITLLLLIILGGNILRSSIFSRTTYFLLDFASSEIQHISINSIKLMQNQAEFYIDSAPDIPLDKGRIDLLLNNLLKTRIVASYISDPNEDDSIFDNAPNIQIAGPDRNIKLQVGGIRDGQQYFKSGERVLISDTVLLPFLRDEASFWYDYKVIDRNLQAADAIGLFFDGDYFDSSFSIVKINVDGKGDLWQWEGQEVPYLQIERFFSRLHSIDGSRISSNSTDLNKAGSVLIALANGRDYILTLYLDKTDSNLWVSADRNHYYQLNPANASYIPQNAAVFLQPD